ncbi:MAG: hypothetical protein MK214_03740 [Thalassotalea sp.]|nr:hypothetical protein [Thalassotalea sp.]
MKSEKSYLRVAKKLGYFFLVIILFIAVGGIYQGFKEAHSDNKASTKEASEKH